MMKSIILSCVLLALIGCTNTANKGKTAGQPPLTPPLDPIFDPASEKNASDAYFVPPTQGLPQYATGAFQDGVLSSLLTNKIPASAENRSGVPVLTTNLSVGTGQAARQLHWKLVGANGTVQQEGTFNTGLSEEQWTKGSNITFRRLGYKFGEELVFRLKGSSAKVREVPRIGDEARAVPKVLPQTSDAVHRVGLAPLQFAPSSAKASLPGALKTALQQRGFSMTTVNSIDQDDFVVHGKISSHASSNGQERVFFEWFVEQGGLRQIAKADWSETVPKGALETNWPRYEQKVAEGIANMVLQASQAVRTGAI